MLVSYTIFALLLIGCRAEEDFPEDMTPSELITSNGYPVQEYTVNTTDGYILTLFRIPSGKDGLFEKKKGQRKPAVLLQHGLLCSCWEFISNTPDKALAYVLADAGFDVWLGNNRGNIYSNTHVTLTQNDTDYWRFSWDQMAQYDVPAMVNKITKTTRQRSIYYVGHSQGGLQMFAAGATNRVLARKIKHFFGLAPILTFQHSIPFNELLYNFTAGFEYPETAVADQIYSIPVVNQICTNETTEECTEFLSSLFGQSNQINQERMPHLVAHLPAGTSLQNLEHIEQMANETKYFDYGTEGNQAIYESDEAPSYNFTKFKIPTTIYYSAADALVTVKDVNNILDTYSTCTLGKAVKLTGFSHMDFVWGDRAKAEIYDHIIMDINMFEAKPKFDAEFGI